MGRKQDALRGFESPLTFMAHNRVTTQGPLASTPDVAKPSRAALPDHGASIGEGSTALAHHSAYLALIHEDPKTPRPRRLIAMEPFVPVAIRIREPALPSPPNRMISTKLLLAFYSSKHSGQRSDTWPRFFKNEDRFQKEQE